MKSFGTASSILTTQKELLKDLVKLDVELRVDSTTAYLAALSAQPALIDRIKVAQQKDPFLQRLCVPRDHALRREIMGDTHNTSYTIHLAHFLPYRTSASIEKLANMYMNERVRVHGVLVSIVSYRDTRFLSHFWTSLQQALGTQLNFSTAFHPQTDGQSERTIQILADMLRACVLDWKEVGERSILDPELVQQSSEIVQLIKEGLRAAQSRCHPLEVSLGVHDVFHVSLLRKYIPNPSHIIDSEPIQLREDLTYDEHPIHILDFKEREMQRRTICFVKPRVLLFFFLSPAPNKEPKPDNITHLKNRNFQICSDLFLLSVLRCVCGCEFSKFLIPKISPTLLLASLNLQLRFAC
ncbi:hypothetical protein SLEP1_g28701 [Rubroshorea leprosula]|uniref:Integrase catalytic domain-containing protein n=1 Tax=Rubroshorea leprosula TaxID=152421 RepID=A0AAV5K5Q1_9ROSI|nr:hypothetical protein SLEP1_g28701 [Rubroshorea leprosula]